LETQSRHSWATHDWPERQSASFTQSTSVHTPPTHPRPPTPAEQSPSLLQELAARQKPPEQKGRRFTQSVSVLHRLDTQRSPTHISAPPQLASEVQVKGWAAAGGAETAAPEIMPRARTSQSGARDRNLRVMLYLPVATRGYAPRRR
jgi:hypothetical protein